MRESLSRQRQRRASMDLTRRNASTRGTTTAVTHSVAWVLRCTRAMNNPLRFISLVLPLVACGAPGTKPRDMSVSGHEQAARTHEKAAEDFQAKCAQRPMPAPCWKSRNYWVVEEHRQVASQHREASAELRAAEERPCVGVTAEDRDISPFERTADIATVAPTVDGVVVTFRLVPGLTAERLQRIVDCHLALNSSGAHMVREMPDCPLVPRGAQAKVRAVGDVFAVDVRGDDQNAVAEIRARGERLLRRAQAETRVFVE